MWCDPPPFICQQEEVQTKPADSYLTAPFTITELDRALKQHNNSAPGMDSIHYPMLARLPPSGKRKLLDIFNNIWLNKIPIPQDWFTYITIPIPKPGKPANQAESHRPIALASCVLKTYERLIRNRLEHWLEYNKLLPPSQFGFRRGCSTQESVGNLVTDIQLAFTKNNSISAIFIDIQGAYDNVNINLLTSKMKKIGIPSVLIKNVYELYKNRYIYVRIAGQIIGPRTTSLGLPQGSILSPLLYIIYSSDLDINLPPRIKTLQFADDICLYSEEKSIEECNQILSFAMENVHNWCVSNGLDIAASKSVVSFADMAQYAPLLHQIDGLPNFSIKYENYGYLETSLLGSFSNVPETYRNQTFQGYINNQWNHYEYIYTDGSKHKDTVGCAVWYPKQKISLKYKLPDTATVYSAELLAIREALQLCLRSSEQSFVIFTDCKSAIMKLTSATPPITDKLYRG
ncbi:hypothetical protein NQ317_003951 [Molorchus minor]|uniref:Reverse transcriptase domain-containing protein n=1 Tax=Molorchus minor TaxID=1323400 RepID=A0ABQ9IPV3_9CUCU|nr:hypothetical protein NQ317_003951 [Molorchus minor]